jgi:lysophospholipase L1-like esterase
MHTDACTFSAVVTVSPQISLTRFVAFGDSITWGEDGSIVDDCPAFVPSGGFQLQSFGPRVQVATQDQYPSQLQTSLQSRYVAQATTISVANRGNPTQQASDPNTLCCDPMHSFTGAVLSGNYQSVLIMEGANDLPNNDAGAINGLRQMIDAARGANIRPYLATIPPEEGSPRPSFPDCVRGGNAPYVTGLNDQIKSLAAAEGVTLVDVYQSFPSGDVIGLGLIGHDGLHPTPSGYSLIAQTFFNALKSTLEISH